MTINASAGSSRFAESFDSERRDLGRGPHGTDEISALGLVNAILRHRATVIGWALLCFVLVSAIGLLARRTYTVESTLIPEAGKTPATISGLAAQFGLALPTSGDGARSPAFYADLLKSKTMLGAVVDSPLVYRSNGRIVRTMLADVYESTGPTPAVRREKTIRHLGKDIDANTIQKTGVVQLAVTVRDPALAVAISQRLLELLNRFNLQTRQSQAAAERRFAERRLEEVRRDLRAAEDRLQNFLQRNRDFRNSPELAFQQDRLAREVGVQQQVFNTLNAAYEQAKIDEVRDTPVITVLQRPELPARPDPRGLLGKGVLALLVGSLIGAGIAIARAYADNMTHLGSPEVAEFAALRRETVGDLLRPWRLLRRPIHRSVPGSSD